MSAATLTPLCGHTCSSGGRMVVLEEALWGNKQAGAQPRSLRRQEKERRTTSSRLWMMAQSPTEGRGGEIGPQDVLRGCTDGAQRTKSNMIRVFISSTFTGQITSVGSERTYAWCSAPVWSSNMKSHQSWNWFNDEELCSCSSSLNQNDEQLQNFHRSIFLQLHQSGSDSAALSNITDYNW